MTTPRARLLALATGTALSVAGAIGYAQESFTPEQHKAGSAIFANNCSPCHGPRMEDPQGAFDLRTFPKDARARFFTSVAKGKNSMPPWGDMLSEKDIEALWAYVYLGDKPR